VLCFGRDQGRNVTYTSPRRWLPGFQPLDGETALRALLKRYLYVYGPVAPQHFATWLAIQPRRAAELFESAARDLERVVVDGARAWTLAGDTAAPGDPHRGVRLLPYFDAYVVGGQPRARPYPGPAGTRALTPSGQAGNYPVLLIDGTSAACGTSGDRGAGWRSPSNRSVRSHPANDASSMTRPRSSLR
jgi:hypothetical protein